MPTTHYQQLTKSAMEEIFNVEVVAPQLEYITHEEYTMQMEREANRKLKAKLRMKLKFKKASKAAEEKLREYKEIYPSDKVTIEEIRKFYEEHCEVKNIT